MKKLSTAEICFLIGNGMGISLCDVLARHSIKLSPYDIASVAICMHASGRVVFSLSEDDMPPHPLCYSIIEPDATHDSERYILVVASKGLHAHFMITSDDTRLTDLQKDLDKFVAEILELFKQANEITKIHTPSP